MMVSENRVLEKIFGPKRAEVKGEWKELHSDELYDLYCTPNVIRVIKPRRMRWGACSAYGGEVGFIQIFGRRTLGKETTWKNQT
jgi:hypothetical protein